MNDTRSLEDGFGHPLVILHDLPAIVWEADGEDYQVTWVSDGAERILGHDPREWVSEPGFWESHLHPDDRDAAVLQTEQAIGRLASVDLVYRFRAADGTYRWFRDSLQVHVTETGRPRMTGVMLDITEEHTAQAAHDLLARERNRLLQAIELTGDGIAFADEHGRLLYANAAYERLTGRARRLQLGQVVAGWTAEDPATGRRILEAAADGPVWTGEVALDADGAAGRRLGATIARVLDDHGAVTGFIGVHRPVD